MQNCARSDKIRGDVRKIYIFSGERYDGIFMTIWQQLGIEPTNDIKEIKRAYAKQLQIYHPEEDAEGYQALREAYDRAIKLVNQRMDRSDDHIPVQTIERDEPEGQEDQEEQEGDENAAVFISRLSRDAGVVFRNRSFMNLGIPLEVSMSS